MAVTAFATRNRKEILRDPLSIVFGIGFPLVILILLSFLQKSLPGMSDIFAIENFVPGIAVFGLTFISLFSGMLISGDRSSSYLMRLFTSPLSGIDYIIGYSYPLLPMAILQSAICFLTGVILGMPVSVNILFSIVALIPVAVLFISIGLMMGSVLSQKQMNGAGAILTNSVLFLGGIVIPLNTIGGTFQTICNLLPFVHAVDLVQSVLSDNYSEVFQHLWWVLGYTAVIFILAVIFFKKKMKG
ncbi:ABC transporter permease [Staphylococcus saprophyticus]|uniref:ABC transporter permease n=1 Tax=Staphylococcus TaxID=1279 RepID=UPI000D1987C6|nr:MULTISPECIES: ABC transporter permease [Staphylococcus]PTH22303.1 ABC transporter permease [Staphylococcus arlettae]PTH50901.1 ABC transporter permease [Staphylococcus arlettae]PTJ62329.1 ABC transporter permease [Staphylococcus saprophyticus]PTK14170.1 ABC transporter permease [Staphylococcus saprophyticus]